MTMGRRPLPPDEKREEIRIYIKPDLRRYLVQVGGGNPTRAIEVMASHYQQKQSEEQEKINA